jgi:hypothetical protein
MDRRIAAAIDLLRHAGACFPDSGAALSGATIVAAALDRARAGTLADVEETALVPSKSDGELAAKS